MLVRGDSVPHFELRTLEGEIVRYATIWQHRILVLVTLPAAERVPVGADDMAPLTKKIGALESGDIAVVITRDMVPGLPGPAVVVADRWGEIAHVAAAAEAADLPDADEIHDWVEYVRSRCPECEGETR